MKSHITDALAYAMATPKSPSIQREPIHDGSFFTLDHPHIKGCDLNIRVGSASDEGDVEVRQADVEELRDCDRIVPVGQDYHDCPKRGKVRLR